MWDFTHTCIPNCLSLTCKSLPLYKFWLSPTSSPLLMSFSFTSASSMSFLFTIHRITCQPHTLIHENVAYTSMFIGNLHYTIILAPLTILLYQEFSNFQDCLCWSFRFALSLLGKRPWTPRHICRKPT